ncbi:MAG TPA: chemotaxis protein CheW [Thermodesulfobacteriota bacterium]
MTATQEWLDLDAETRFRPVELREAQAAPAEETRELLAFTLAGEEYAIEIGSIEEIVRVRPVTEVPFAPPFCPGLVSLRGRIVTIIDLRVRLGLPAEAPGRGARIIVSSDRGRTVGLLVDGVTGVIRLRPSDLEATPVVVGGVDGEFVQGLGRVGGRLVILLNLPRVLDFTIEGDGAAR